MSDTQFLDNLKSFGLTGQEATIYWALLKNGSMTGYEVAKETGISRSNVYSALSALTDKGAAYLCEGEAIKYLPVSIKVFTENSIKALTQKAKELEISAPRPLEKTEGYITIKGQRHIKDKILEMLKNCDLRLYVMAEWSLIEEYKEDLQKLVLENKKVVILADNCEIEGAIFYKTEPEPGQIRLITDSSYVLTGSLMGKDDSCLYSGQETLISVMKEAIKNKITLIQLDEEKQK